MLQIASYGQKVSDSLICFTPNEVNYFTTKCFEVKRLQADSTHLYKMGVFLNNQLILKDSISVMDARVISTYQNEISLLNLKLGLNIDEVKNLKRRNRKLVIGCTSISIASISLGVYLSTR